MKGPLFVAILSALAVLSASAENAAQQQPEQPSSSRASILGRPLSNAAAQEQKSELQAVRRQLAKTAPIVSQVTPSKTTTTNAQRKGTRRANRRLPVKENTYDDAYVTDDAAVDDEYYYEGKGGKGYGGKGYAGKGCSGKGCGGKSGGKSGGKGGGKSGGKAVHGGKGHGGGGGKGKGKGHVKEHPGKGGKGTYDDDFYPSIDDFYLDDQYYDDEFINGDQCQLVTFNETFSIPGATLFLAPDTSVADPGNPDLPGTVFIFEVVDVLEINGVTPIQGTTLSGTCTRTDVDPDGGGGICQFVFLDEEGYSITVEGFLPGPLGGPLAVTGGTGDMVGVNGEMDFFPIFDADEEGDIFIDAIRYEVIADLGIIVCP